jgi:hypothetical protein
MQRIWSWSRVGSVMPSKRFGRPWHKGAAMVHINTIALSPSGPRCRRLEKGRLCPTEGLHVNAGREVEEASARIDEREMKAQPSTPHGGRKASETHASHVLLGVASALDQHCRPAAMQGIPHVDSLLGRGSAPAPSSPCRMGREDRVRSRGISRFASLSGGKGRVTR